jgi:hypothetical protein
MIVALIISLAAVATPRPFTEERELLDRRLETLRRLLPDAANPTGNAALLREMASGARLGRVDAIARPPVESGARGDDVVDLEALGRYGDIERFFRQVALSTRLIDVESLTLSAAPEDLVHMQAVLRLPFRPASAPLPPAPEGLRARPAGVPKFQGEAFVRDQVLALAKSEQIVTLRRARRNPRLFLCELAAVVRDRPVVLAHASFGEEFVVRGLSVGEGPTRALESRFERGFFRVSEFLMAGHGACRRFEVHGKSPVVGPEAELPLPVEDPFTQDELPCRMDRDEARSAIVVKGGKPQGVGPLTLRLRDVDLADAFQVLHQLSGQPFLVDGDVVGRVSVELAHVSPDEALAALVKGSGLIATDLPPIKRISRARPAPRDKLETDGGTRGTFLLKRGEARELLSVMAELDPTLASLGPPGALGRLSLWARDVPLAALRAAVLASLGLQDKIEEGRRIVERPGGGDPAVPVAFDAPDRRLALRPQDLAVQELELSGVTFDGTRWTAWAYTPTGVLCGYAAGGRLADGVVQGVAADEVVLQTDAGAVRLPIAPPSQ